eukprot:12643753-Alexandrium_andersonii.AAC.1
MSASLVGSEMCIRDSPWIPASVGGFGLCANKKRRGTHPSGASGANVEACLLYTSDAADDM